MNPAAIGLALLQYGPTILPMLQEVAKWIEDKKDTVSSDDIAKLIAYGKPTAADYLTAAGGAPAAAPGA